MDRIENMNGVKMQPGGAALYAAMAARTLFPEVHLISRVGKDYKFFEVLDLFRFKHVKIYNMPSTRFHIKYNDRWEAKYLNVDHGAGARITSHILPLNLLGNHVAIHISPMRVAKVVKIIDMIKRESPGTMISINTWLGYIHEGKQSREALKKLALKVDFFILSDSEAKALTQTSSVSTALRLLKAKNLVVTLGELGAIISNESGIQMIPALSFPIGKVVDTTGAGDTWCGAFLASYKLTQNLMKSVTVASIISSIKCSGWGFEKLKNLHFRELDDVIEHIIALKEGSLQKRLIDYIYPDHASLK
jgi:sugar/nucleoside kinase (ribokinase family)